MKRTKVNRDALDNDFINACYIGNLALVNIMLSVDDKPNIHVDDDVAFRLACYRGNLAVVNRLLELTGDDKPNIHADGDSAFYEASAAGHLDVVNRLLELTGDDKPNIHAREDYAFRVACRHGHLAVVNRLLQLSGSDKPDIHARNDHAFNEACENGDVPMVNRLLIEDKFPSNILRWNTFYIRPRLDRQDLETLIFATHYENLKKSSLAVKQLPKDIQKNITTFLPNVLTNYIASSEETERTNIKDRFREYMQTKSGVEGKLCLKCNKPIINNTSVNSLHHSLTSNTSRQ